MANVFQIRNYWQIVLALGVSMFLIHARADSTNLLSKPTNAFVAPVVLAHKEFESARTRYQKNPTNSEAAWQFGRACFDLAETAPSNRQREEIANQGISVCRQLVSREPDSAPGHYYLGMNLAQLARTKHLGALKLLREMEREFLKTRALDPQFDFAGGDRNLGMIYHEAPGWPASIGDKKKARQHLERAFKSSPEFPENGLYLVEAEVAWGERKSAQEHFKALEKIWLAAKKNFFGEKWTASWDDWEKRLRKIKTKLGN